MTHSVSSNLGLDVRLVNSATPHLCTHTVLRGVKAIPACCCRRLYTQMDTPSGSNRISAPAPLTRPKGTSVRDFRCTRDWFPYHSGSLWNQVLGALGPEPHATVPLPHRFPANRSRHYAASLWHKPLLFYWTTCRGQTCPYSVRSRHPVSIQLLPRPPGVPPVPRAQLCV